MFYVQWAGGSCQMGDCTHGFLEFPAREEADAFIDKELRPQASDVDWKLLEGELQTLASNDST